ncbi:unnamed protein product [Discosporangium mesarthrocarpum]
MNLLSSSASPWTKSTWATPQVANLVRGAASFLAYTQFPINGVRGEHLEGNGYCNRERGRPPGSPAFFDARWGDLSNEKRSLSSIITSVSAAKSSRQDFAHGRGINIPKQCSQQSYVLGQKIAKRLRDHGVNLVLHLDVNKTIIMVDPAGGKTQEQVLNSALAEICWGEVTHLGKEEVVWVWDEVNLGDLFAEAKVSDAVFRSATMCSNWRMQD